MSGWKSVCFVVLLLFVCSVSFADGITKGDIDKSIDKGSLQHPYLYFTEAEKPAILARINSDQESHDIMERLLAEANRMLYMPVETVIPIQGRNTRADWTEYDLSLIHI